MLKCSGVIKTVDFMDHAWANYCDP